MGTVDEQPAPAAEMRWRAAIGLIIGHDSVAGVGEETEHDTEDAARVWIERHLPLAAFPAWFDGPPQDATDPVLFGTVIPGYRTAEHGWEPDLAAPSYDATFIDGKILWHQEA